MQEQAIIDYWTTIEGLEIDAASVFIFYALSLLQRPADVSLQGRLVCLFFNSHLTSTRQASSGLSFRFLRIPVSKRVENSERKYRA